MMKRLILVLMLVLLGTVALIPASANTTPQPTIVGLALAANAQTGEFSTLIAALQAADLVGALNGGGQFTVFAPTDAAFARMGLNKDNVGSVPKTTLTNILLYHVSSGERFASSFRSLQFLRMLNNQSTLVYRFFGNVYVNRSKVIIANLDASNGVIHVIDRVLTPPRR